jgi:phosphatidate phosphatase PAH1
MKIIYVDIDGTICNSIDGSGQYMQYDEVVPRYNQIEKINKLYDEGNTIIYWTSRGTATLINWLDLTKNQLDEWGCKYHDVRCGKPQYHLWIDDKSKRIEEI